MQKHAHLKIKLPPSHKVSVKKGDRIAAGDTLTHTSQEIDEFDLGRLLGVSTSQVGRYVLVKEDEHIEEGQVIARKKSVMSTQTVRSPVSGSFTWTDKEKGLVGIKRQAGVEPIVASVDGIVAEILDDAMVIQVKGVVLPAKGGKGGPISGMLYKIDNPTLFDVPENIEECVVVVKEAPSSFVAKVDALGAVGIVAETLDEPPFSLPYLLFDSVEDIFSLGLRPVLVLGEENQLLVLDHERERENTPASTSSKTKK